MNRLIVYIHGKGGNAEEAEHYKSLFKDYEVIGFDYAAQLPWEAKDDFPERQADRESSFHFSRCEYGKADYRYDDVGKCDRR